MSTRRIRVIDAVEVKSGTSDSGRAWALYEITATTPEGEPIDLKLKSFTKLHGEVEVEVEKQEHEKYGTSYLLKLPGGGGSGNPGARLGPKVDELRGRIERLEGIVEAHGGRITGLEQLAQLADRQGNERSERVYGQPPRNALFDDEEAAF